MRHRLTPPKYRELKRYIAERDECCRLCGDPSSMTPHHIISRGMGGGDYEENIITLCVSCHGEVEQGKQEVPDSELERIGFYNLEYSTKDRKQWLKE